MKGGLHSCLQCNYPLSGKLLSKNLEMHGRPASCAVSKTFRNPVCLGGKQECPPAISTWVSFSFYLFVRWITTIWGSNLKKNTPTWLCSMGDPLVCSRETRRAFLQIRTCPANKRFAAMTQKTHRSDLVGLPGLRLFFGGNHAICGGGICLRGSGGRVFLFCFLGHTPACQHLHLGGNGEQGLLDTRGNLLPDCAAWRHGYCGCVKIGPLHNCPL